MGGLFILDMLQPEVYTSFVYYPELLHNNIWLFHVFTKLHLYYHSSPILFKMFKLHWQISATVYQQDVTALYV